RGVSRVSRVRFPRPSRAAAAAAVAADADGAGRTPRRSASIWNTPRRACAGRSSSSRRCRDSGPPHVPLTAGGCGAGHRRALTAPPQPSRGGGAVSTKTFRDNDRVLSVIMGGGAGTRLFPLTKERAKPAVPLAGKYRLVDIPISNCINSGLNRIYLLTQFNSASLHRHITQAYKFDHFAESFVELLAAEQTHSDTSWYQGTADAVRKNLVHFLNFDFDYVLVLSGDQLYRMDYGTILSQHVQTDADVTIATIPVRQRAAHAFGIMQMARDLRITRFVEKPKDPEVQQSLMVPTDLYPSLGIEDDGEGRLLASMGIYVFNRDVLRELLDNDWPDFGKHVIPAAIETHNVYSYVFQGYWEDIGTIRAFFEASLELAAELPRFNFFDMESPI